MSDIGYGKPPKSGQFKKGKSGNPKGRPKGSKSLKTVVQKELAQKLDIKEHGKPKKVTKLEALVKKISTDALNGQTRAQTELLKLAVLYAPEASDAQGASTPASEEDQAVIDAFVKRMMAVSKKGGE